MVKRMNLIPFGYDSMNKYKVENQQYLISKPTERINKTTKRYKNGKQENKTEKNGKRKSIIQNIIQQYSNKKENLISRN